MQLIVKNLYSLFIILIMPFIGFILWRNMKKYRLQHRFKERLGFINNQQADIWIHASSMGEVNACFEFCQKLPANKIILSTTTATGFLAVQDIFTDKLPHFFFGFDLAFIWRRVLLRIKPKKLILLEREVWPNLINQCQRAGVKVYLVNAKFSTRSLHKANKLKILILPSLQSMHKILAQSKADCQRFATFGVNPDKCLVAGNLKFDLQIPKLKPIKLPHSLVIVAGSTRHGEEEILLQIHQKISQQFPQTLLIIAPRHPQRFAEVWLLIQKFKQNSVRFSIGDLPLLTDKVMLLDTLGELMSFYASADICFVGGSLLPGVGGHNLLEPAILQKPVISGQYLSEIKHIVNLLGQALQQFTTVEQGVKLITKLAQNPQLRQKLAQIGFDAINNNKGAAELCARQVMKKTTEN